jgi:hypothetical protein
MNGVHVRFCFKVTREKKLIAAMVFGDLGMAGAWKKYADSMQEITELRRLVCIDDTPKNTESWFIGNALRWLRDNTNINKVISYADETHGHTGIIYKATNFKHLGMTASGRMIEYGDKLYHDKAIRTTYNGKLKPYAERLKAALETGAARYIETKGKHIYLYEMNRKKRNVRNLNGQKQGQLWGSNA